jgi:Flp pilus assembly protein TadB
MLLESGAATPESALTRAAFLFDDPSVEVVREAARLREVELIPIDQALERVAARYSVEPLHRLADAYRIAVQYGTGISGVLTDFSDYLRSRTESDERARITSAPVRMVPVALLFFLVPFMSLIGFLIYGPLVGLLGQV